MIDPHNVLVLGDSVIQRFGVQQSQLDFHPWRAKITYVGVPGATALDLTRLPSLPNHLRPIPSLVVLWVGGNDLCSTSPSKVVSHLLSLSLFLHHGFGVPKIRICRLLTRESPRGISKAVYKRRVQETNRLLKRACRLHQDVVQCVRLKGMTYPAGRHLLTSSGTMYDGIHPSPDVGMVSLKYALRWIVNNAIPPFELPDNIPK